MRLQDVLSGLPWPQIYGAIAGGVFGGFSGFIANSVLRRYDTRTHVRNAACALSAEIGALCQHIESGYLAALDVQLALPPTQLPSASRYYHFRGERDYMPVFRSLGATIGFLPRPLPHELVSWYTGLAVCLERAHELHELGMRDEPEWRDRSLDVATTQRAAFSTLLERATALIERLGKL
ncbi:MAG: hypothetical protein ABW187_03005 [Dokdonella sp.]